MHSKNVKALDIFKLDLNNENYTLVNVKIHAIIVLQWINTYVYSEQYFNIN